MSLVQVFGSVARCVARFMDMFDCCPEPEAPAPSFSYGETIPLLSSSKVRVVHSYGVVPNISLANSLLDPNVNTMLC